MTRLRPLSVAIDGDQLENLRTTTMTGRYTIANALVFNLINELCERVEALEAELDARSRDAKAAKPVPKSTPRKATAKNASNQSGGTIDETPKSEDEPASE